jgi:hypothetical protein
MRWFMKIYEDNGNTVNIKTWTYGEAELKPFQIKNELDEFNISINDEKITVYYNKSKSSVDYYYLKYKGLWHWTRDNIRNNSQYTT